MNSIAPEGQVWVCAACGKRSKDLYGQQPINRGWDVSCTCNAILCHEDKLVLGTDERVKKVLDGGVVKNAFALPPGDPENVRVPKGMPDALAEMLNKDATNDI